MSPLSKTISPVDGSIYVERELASDAEAADLLSRARSAQENWRQVPIALRAQRCSRMVDALMARTDVAAQEITWQMGRPIAWSPRELGGFEERARFMIELAEDALRAIELAPKTGFRRFIQREPLGVVLTISPWNYPYLAAVNSVVPAILAGNSVILRHSAQTPLCAERIGEAFDQAGLPSGVFQFLHCGHAETERLIASPGVDYVAFTGSVPAGRRIQHAAADRFINLGLELGGKDPAYVRADADLEYSVGELVDGAFFNSGQSCCGVERIYVHADVYAAFVEAFASQVREYRLGNPTDPETNLGPMVNAKAADFVRAQNAEAISAGARGLVDPKGFAADAPGTPYLAPQILVDVDHSMRAMREESFGPVVGIQRVADDEEALHWMNDSPFGLTASVWTRDTDVALALGAKVDTGTWFMNRCDYLDPGLAWTGVKDSGRGCSLSRVGFEVLTRPKSFHLKNP